MQLNLYSERPSTLPTLTQVLKATSTTESSSKTLREIVETSDLKSSLGLALKALVKQNPIKHQKTTSVRDQLRQLDSKVALININESETN